MYVRSDCLHPSISTYTTDTHPMNEPKHSNTHGIMTRRPSYVVPLPGHESDRNAVLFAADEDLDRESDVRVGEVVVPVPRLEFRQRLWWSYTKEDDTKGDDKRMYICIHTMV